MALSKEAIDIVNLLRGKKLVPLFDNSVLEELFMIVGEQGAKIYESQEAAHGRTRSQVYCSVFNGYAGEFAISKHLKEAGVSCEKPGVRKDVDFVFNGLWTEIKRMSGMHSMPSFNDPQMTKTIRAASESGALDLVIFYKYFTDEQLKKLGIGELHFVLPWIAADGKTFSELLAPSKYNSGYFYKLDIALGRGDAVIINPVPAGLTPKDFERLKAVPDEEDLDFM